MQRNVVNDIYKTSSTIGRYRAVIADSSLEGGVKLPAAEGDSHFVGVTQDACSGADSLAVAVSGQVEVYANGSITSGQYLKIASSAGDVKNAENATPAATWVVGMAKSNASNGDRVDMEIIKAGYMTI